MTFQRTCLGRYGGPVFPWVALGGFPDGEYLNATALVVTYSVMNYQNDTFQKMAEAWEEKFIEYLQRYMGEDIDIAFSAQVSSHFQAAHMLNVNQEIDC